MVQLSKKSSKKPKAAKPQDPNKLVTVETHFDFLEGAFDRATKTRSALMVVVVLAVAFLAWQAFSGARATMVAISADQKTEQLDSQYLANVNRLKQEDNAQGFSEADLSGHLSSRCEAYKNIAATQQDVVQILDLAMDSSNEAGTSWSMLAYTDITDSKASGSTKTASEIFTDGDSTSPDSIKVNSSLLEQSRLLQAPTSGTPPEVFSGTGNLWSFMITYEINPEQAQSALARSAAGLDELCLKEKG